MPHDLQPRLEEDIIQEIVSNLDGRTFLSEETALHQDEKMMTSEVELAQDAGPDSYDHL